jgi:hypothetical protein
MILQMYSKWDAHFAFLQNKAATCGVDEGPESLDAIRAIIKHAVSRVIYTHLSDEIRLAS